MKEYQYIILQMISGIFSLGNNLCFPSQNKFNFTPPFLTSKVPKDKKTGIF